MLKPKTLGPFFFILFLLALGYFVWTWVGIFKDPGPTDGPALGIFMIVLICSTIYYFVLTVWAWRLCYRDDSSFSMNLKIQYLLIFAFGVLIPLALMIKVY